MTTIDMNARPRLRAHLRLQWDPVRAKQVLLGPEKVVVLNETAAAILARCNGQRTVSDIAAELGAQYQQTVDADVLNLLNRLGDKGLIEVDSHD
jgi:pyrroloquinoline quinone biosynthesis protein D